MDVTHKEENHGHFRRKDTHAPPRLVSTEATNRSLTLSDNLKAAMVSKFKRSNDEAAKLWSDVDKSSGDF